MMEIRIIKTFCFQCGDQLTAAEVNGAHIKALRESDRQLRLATLQALQALSAGDVDMARKYLLRARRVAEVKVEDDE